MRRAGAAQAAELSHLTDSDSGSDLNWTTTTTTTVLGDHHDFTLQFSLTV